MPITYKPYHERTVDTQYHELLAHIMKSGRVVHPIHGEESRMILGHQMRFKMENGFPLITERSLSKMWKNGLGEFIAFMNGARTHEELKLFGCSWWNRWTTGEHCAKFGLPEGDLGNGSYGEVMARFPDTNGKTLNQIEVLLEQIKDMPFLRSHVTTTWLPPRVLQSKTRQRDTVVAPCHGNFVHFAVYPDDGEMDMHHVQRSGDLPVGVPFNFVHYAAYGMMVAHITGYTFNELVYTFSDVHIYESQYENVEEILSRAPRPFPTVLLDKNISDIFKFRPEHFELSDYDPHPGMKIPTPV
ncbi:MAG: thymidylate synthase [Parcubacteria group bacterium]|nr:thymidylate synthase [Parcubacteria group bacterium]